MSHRPAVSVVIPAYNADPYLADAIRSVLSSTVQDLEIIVVNDGSTDDTAAVARSYDDPRILVLDKPNGGVSSSRNLGLELANGEHITFLDADDAMEPTNLEEKLDHLQQSGRAWVFGDLILCDAHLTPTGEILKGTNGDVVRTILLGEQTAVPAMCSNALLHRRCFNGGYRFPEVLSNAADQHFTLAMATEHSYSYLPRPLDRYRQLPHSMSRNVALYAADHQRLMLEAASMGLLDDRSLRRICRSNMHWSIGGSWWVNGRSTWKAIPHFIAALLEDPRVLARWVGRKTTG